MPHFAVCLRFLSGQTDSPRPITPLCRNKVVFCCLFPLSAIESAGLMSFGPGAPVERNVAFQARPVEAGGGGPSLPL